MNTVKICFLPALFFGVISVLSSAECIQVQAESFAAAINKKISKEGFDAGLLEKAVFYFSNIARKKHGAPVCGNDMLLHRAAQQHSREMAELRYFSHTSPDTANRTLEDRLRRQGVRLRNVCIGENLAVDFILDISGRVYYTEQEGGKTVYVDNETGREIIPQTYKQFARSVVRHWLESPEHRENLLNGMFTRMEVGVYRGTYKGLAAVYVTQNFYGHISMEKVSG